MPTVVLRRCLLFLIFLAFPAVAGATARHAPFDDVNPQVSPRGDEIAFWRDTRQDHVLTVMRLDGSRLRRVASVRALPLPEDVYWSPDGRHIAFEHGELYVVAMTGGKPRRVTDEFSREGASYLSIDGWRDSGAIDYEATICCSDHIDQDFARTVSVTGKQVTRPSFDNECVPWHSCAFSPDVRSVVWVESSIGPDEMFYRHAGETSVTPLGEGAYPTWSPDGDRFAYVRVTGDTNALVVADASTASIQTVYSTHASVDSIQWAPNGARIAFIAPLGQVRQLWVAKLDGSRPVPVTAGVSGAASIREWSPRGTWIAYLAKPPVHALTLSVVHPDGTGGHPLLTWHTPLDKLPSPGIPFHESLSWSRNEKVAVFMDTFGCGNYFAVFRLDPASGRTRRITNTCL